MSPLKSDLGLKPRLDACPACLYQADAFRLSQKITLTAGGKVYVFNGYLAVRQPGSLRASAFGEMSGRMFDLLVTPEGGQVLFKPDPIPPRPLEGGVLGDLKFLFLPAKAQGFEDSSGRLVLVRQTVDGVVVREASFEDFRPLSQGAPWQGPGRIILENRRWHYRLEIENLSLNPAPPEDKAFSVQP